MDPFAPSLWRYLWSRRASTPQMKKPWHSSASCHRYV